MGNCFRRLEDVPSNEKMSRSQGGAGMQQAGSLGAHGVTVETVGFAAFARDLFHFEATGTVPEGLGQHVRVSKNAQALWYGKLLVAWRSSKPPPSNSAEASRLILQTLQGHRRADLQRLLAYYALPPYTPPPLEPPAPTLVVPAPAPTLPSFIVPRQLPPGVKYELITLPIDITQITDGDTLNVYVEVGKDVASGAVPNNVLEAVAARRTAQKQNDLQTLKVIEKQINKAGYKVFDSTAGQPEVLAHKYRVRLRGVDAPEKTMPFGLQSKEYFSGLVAGKPLEVFVYNTDQYGRVVADVYANNKFLQETLLRNGCVWHYAAYDKRPEFSQWEQEARRSGVGLWSSSDPQAPWEYRKQLKAKSKAG